MNKKAEKMLVKYKATLINNRKQNQRHMDERNKEVNHEEVKKNVDSSTSR